MTANWNERRSVAYAAVLVLSLLLVIPGTTGEPFLHDSHGLNLVWADQFTSQLRGGNLYPRWLPDSHDGLGSPTFYFYPPLSFHAAGLFGILGLSTYSSLLASFAAFFALSGIGMWHWLRGRSQAPLLGALLFMVLPYHLLDFTLRGALAESLGIALLPWIAIGMRRVAERRGSALLALGYGALIMSHLPLALLASVFMIAPYALWHRTRTWHFALPLALGIGLSGIFLVPALGLEPFRDAAKLYDGVQYQAGNSGLWQADLTNIHLVLFLVLGACVALPLIAFAIVRRDRWAIGGAGVALLALGILPFFWSLPLLSKVQFPWRSLPIAEFALATVVARQLVMRLWMWLSLVSAVSLSAVMMLFVPSPTPEKMHLLTTRHPDVFEMLPPGVVSYQRPRLLVNPSELQEGRVPPPTVAGMIVRPVFYFPRWSCGEIEPRTKLLMHRPGCRPVPITTIWEKAGLALSLLSLLLIGSFALAGRRRAS